MEFLVHASLHQREDAVPCVGLEVSQRAEISEVERPVAECFDGGVVVCGNDQIDRLGDGFRQVIAKGSFQLTTPPDCAQESCGDHNSVGVRVDECRSSRGFSTSGGMHRVSSLLER